MQYPTKLHSYKTINKIRNNIINLEPQFTLYDKKIYFLQRYIEVLTSDGFSREIHHNIENVCHAYPALFEYVRKICPVFRMTHRADWRCECGKCITNYAQNLIETVNYTNRKKGIILARRSYESSVTNDMPSILNAIGHSVHMCTHSLSTNACPCDVYVRYRHGARTHIEL